MQAQMMNLKKFISTSDIVFVIPVYQRNYDWKKENCKQLFEDIKNIAKTPDKTHFIGTICQKMDGRYKSIIIDGQQRITSTMLLVKALHDLTNDDCLKRKVKNQFLINEFVENELKIKLKPIKKDEAIYKKIINSDPFIDKDFDNCEQCSNIYRNYIYFKELAKDAIDHGYKWEEIEDAIERLEIAELTLDKENPQVIFESLNSTGLDLANTDLLRNYLLMPLNYADQERLYNDYWKEMEDMIGSENMENFMTYYLILKRQSDNIAFENKNAKINNKTLYYAFKKFYSNINNDIIRAELLFKDMLKYARYYKHFIFNDNSIASGIDEYFYDIFYILEAKDSAIVMMFLYNLFVDEKIDEPTFKKILKNSISFIFRGLVCKRTGFDKQFAALTIQKLSNNKGYVDIEKTYWDIITSGKGSYSMAKDEEFKQMLRTKDLYNSLKNKRCKYLLLQLEYHINPKERLEYGSGTVEHICPRTLSNDWTTYLNDKRDKMNYENFVHTLGNLTLTGYNSELSNNLFENKRREYMNSNYSITRNICSYGEWTSKQVYQRSSQLSNIALKIWSLPPEYNKDMVVDTGITYTLESDLGSFTGTKPDTISILDQQKVISNWRDFLCEVVNSFYKLDKLLFLELLSYDNFPGNRTIINTNHNGMATYYQVDEGIYINTNNSTEFTLRIIKSIVDFFDTRSGTDFEKEIWFTLKKT